MGYDKKKWEKRTHNRSDMSTHLVHLTKAANGLNEVEVLLKILGDKKIKGSGNGGFVIGDQRAACFQDTPLYGVSQNVYHEAIYREELGGKKRYSAVGLSFYKPYVYRKGGRPCLYEQTSIAKKILPSEEWWRIVAFDLSNTDKILDWTHEREWRVKGDFEFEVDKVTVLLSHIDQYRYFMKNTDKEMLEQLQGIVILSLVL
ncbi:DUF2971 domain-containing protein [Paenibacillus polymyxa]|uniref:DUF2971 domain-containing protein n=1 Tax=Paenibacillus polymyxa TaxID=1406 RepID=UPI002AB572FE|nr:DUF2971 domain-containing protein [Paenibacillus polymyxa]MDY8021729.1 DUF2971 domain-containing protein [Paenibacillus polymyxa]